MNLANWQLDETTLHQYVSQWYGLYYNNIMIINDTFRVVTE